MKTLQNKNIIVTRAAVKGDPLIQAMEGLGANVISVPTFEISPVSSWQACDEAIQKLDAFDWLIFTSSNGVKYFIDRLRDNGLGTNAFSKNRIAAIGEKTAKYLEEQKIKVGLIPNEYRAEGMIESFKQQDLPSQKILIIRPEKTRDVLKVALESLRHTVQEIAVYRNQPVEIDTSVADGYEPDVLTFLSPSAVKNFAKAFGVVQINQWISNGCRVAVIGKVTEQAVRNLELPVHILPEKFTIEKLVDEIEKYFLKELEGIGM